MTTAENNLLRIFEALSNLHRLRIITSLGRKRKYVSELARDVQMSRPLLYMHLQRLEAAGLVFGSLELSEDGKAMKFYELTDFDFNVTPETITQAVQVLTDFAVSENNDEEE